MASYDLEEQEQLEELKTWWKMHGNLVTAVVTAAALVALAWQGWNWWQRSQSAQASAVYGSLQLAAGQKDSKRAKEAAGELIDKFAGTPYAGFGTLIAAKVLMEGGDPKSAQAQLTWAAANAKDEAVRDLARLRLAAILIDDKAYDQALQQLAGEPRPAYVPRFNEMRGDILVAQGKSAEARAAYKTALDKLEESSHDLSEAEAARREPYRDMVQLKLDALGEAK